MITETKEKSNVLREEGNNMNEKIHGLSDEELERVNGGTANSGKWKKFKKDCPNCHQSNVPFVLRGNEWYCIVCNQKIGIYKGLSKDMANYQRG